MRASGMDAAWRALLSQKRPGPGAFRARGLPLRALWARHLAPGGAVPAMAAMLQALRLGPVTGNPPATRPVGSGSRSEVGGAEDLGLLMDSDSESEDGLGPEVCALCMCVCLLYCSSWHRRGDDRGLSLLRAHMCVPS